MKNGEVVLRRLSAIKASLDAATIKIESEINRRDEYTEYQDTYLTDLRKLADQAALLEDEINRLL